MSVTEFRAKTPCRGHNIWTILGAPESVWLARLIGICHAAEADDKPPCGLCQGPEVKDKHAAKGKQQKEALPSHKQQPVEENQCEQQQPHEPPPIEITGPEEAGAASQKAADRAAIVEARKAAQAAKQAEKEVLLPVCTMKL